MTRDCAAPIARSYTLIELLAVLVLLALAAGIGLNGLWALSAQSSLNQAAGLVRDLDARARALAKTEGGVLLVSDDTAHTLSAKLIATSETVLETQLPKGMSLTFAPDTHPAMGLHTIAIARTGRSIDYAASLATDHAQTVIRFAGLTGWPTTTKETKE